MGISFLHEKKPKKMIDRNENKDKLRRVSSYIAKRFLSPNRMLSDSVDIDIEENLSTDHEDSPLEDRTEQSDHITPHPSRECRERAHLLRKTKQSTPCTINNV